MLRIGTCGAALSPHPVDAKALENGIGRLSYGLLTTELIGAWGPVSTIESGHLSCSLAKFGSECKSRLYLGMILPLIDSATGAIWLISVAFAPQMTA
jgi:hypothetical protein